MKRLHLICNAHIDPIWQWEWEEGASAALSTFQSAANLAKDFDYIFCHNEVTLYKYTEKYAPALFEEIKKLVKQGKWHIMGGWYLQPDCVMPCGEGIVRQIREGEIYFEEKFGVKPTTAVNFDPFGHSRGLVQILTKCGQDSYMFMRPYGKYMWNQLKLPAEYFIWEGYDGSRVKASRITEYNSDLGKATEKIQKDIDRQKDDAEVAQSCWGVGNHGGGPSRKDLADVAEMIKNSKNIEIKYSTPEEYFADVRPTEVYAGSLVPCMVGCYTSMAELKKKYRNLERQLFFAEKIASIASLKGSYKYPTELLKDVTEDMLNVQFHDILPGDMIRAGEENGFTYINHGLHILNNIRADAFFALCKGQPVAEENTYPLMVFNPKATAEKQIIECELSIIPTENYIEKRSYIEVYDDKGNKLKSQTVKEGSNISIDWRKKVVFEAEPNAMQITRYTAKTVVLPVKNYPEVKDDIVFDNGEKRVVISAKTGLIESYVVNGKEYCKGKFFKPEIYDDTPDPWGMNEPYVGHNGEELKLLETPDGVFDGMKSIQIIEDGDIYLGVEAFFGLGLTRVRIGYKIYKNGIDVDVDVNVFPNEASKAIKVSLDVGNGRYVGEQIFGKEELFNDGRECIAQNFVALETDKNDYLEIVTQDNFGSSYKDGKVALTLVKTATYCAHPVPNRPLLRDGIFISKIDQGQRDFAFRLTTAKENELKKHADAFVEKPYALNVFPTIDEKDDNGFTVSGDNANISFVTLKRARQVDGYVMRLQNNSETEEKETVKFRDKSINLIFGKYEVKTVVYDGDALKEIKEMLI